MFTQDNFLVSRKLLSEMDFYESLKTLRDLHKVGEKDIWIFRLYRITCVLFVISSIIVSTRLYTGHPMICTQSNKTSEDLLNAYCWINSTFNINDGNAVYNHFYQWYSFMLIIQSFFYFIPIYLLNENVLQIAELDTDALLPEIKFKKIQILVNYLHNTLNTHKWQLINILVCEFLAFVNNLLQIYFLIYIFDIKTPYFDVVLPKTSKCTFRMYGPSGGVQIVDSLCLLPVNVVAEKLYFVIFTWLLILFAMSSLWMIWRLMFLASFRLRKAWFASKNRLSSKILIEDLSQVMDCGDFFLFGIVFDDMDVTIRIDVVYELHRKIYPKKYN